MAWAPPRDAAISAMMLGAGRSARLEQVTLAKRLAQCLNPSLPSGVHNKALKAYDLVFAHLSRARLVADLAIFSIGLFGLFQCAHSIHLIHRCCPSTRPRGLMGCLAHGLRTRLIRRANANGLCMRAA